MTLEVRAQEPGKLPKAPIRDSLLRLSGFVDPNLSEKPSEKIDYASMGKDALSFEPLPFSALPEYTAGTFCNSTENAVGEDLYDLKGNTLLSVD